MRCIALLLLLVCRPLWASEPIHIAVAANFKPTLQHINREFAATTGIQLTLSSASTGMLYSQITHGAPFHLFFAADRTSAEKLASADQDAHTVAFCYARGSLVLVGGNGTLTQLGDPQLSLAIANPKTAPYGRAAADVLARDEFSAGNSRKLLRANNVAQAYQFWHSGAADLALVPRSLTSGNFTEIPEAWHRTLEQYAVALQHNAAIDAYLNWLRSDTVRSQITAAGYQPCP
jgi:molybdate transport system substrate-binding protein